MNLLCSIGLHKWNAKDCRCARGCGAQNPLNDVHDWSANCELCGVCDKTRINAHEWNHGCRCELCGEVRDEMHRWDGCKCTVCSKTRDWGHKWNGCTCSACSETRDQAHRWDGCTCSLCFKTRDEAHSWDGCRCSICAKTRDEAHNWNGCVCSMCRKKRSKGRTYIVGERGWDGCTGHDWSRGYKWCTKCGESGYNVCEEAVDRSRLQDPSQFVDLEDDASLRANPRTYLEIIESFLKLGMDPRQSYWTDGYLNTSGLYSAAGKGEGPNEARPLFKAVAYDCIEALILMDTHGVSLRAPFVGKSLLRHAEDYGSKKIVAYLRRR
jgi:hypothetical protein